MATYTISTTCGGGLGSEIHNVDEDFRKEICGYDTRPHDNFEVWTFTPIQDLYEKRFGDALRKFNQKQVDGCHPERQIESYYEKIVSEEEANIENGKKNKSITHTQYEMIVTIGNKDNCPSADAQKEVYKEFADWFQNEFNQFDINFISWHADEDGTSHMHIGFVPWADGYARGLEVQNSFSKSLKQMGISDKGWGNDFYFLCNERLQRMCEARGWDIIHPQAGSNSKHLETPQYKKVKQAEQMMDDAVALSVNAKTEIEVAKSKMEDEFRKKEQRLYSRYSEDVRKGIAKERTDLEVERQEFRSRMDAESQNLRSKRFSLEKDITDFEKRKKAVTDEIMAIPDAEARLFVGKVKQVQPAFHDKVMNSVQKTLKNFHKDADIDNRSEPIIVEQGYEK